MQALRNAGIYAGVYLFSGEWLNIFRCPDNGYPFTGANNINGIDDGYTGKRLQVLPSTGFEGRLLDQRARKVDKRRIDAIAPIPC
jgi:hypothetical protein